MEPIDLCTLLIVLGSEMLKLKVHKTIARALIINVACTNKCSKELSFER